MPSIPITPIEKQILEDTAMGRSPKQIAVKLGIPKNTIVRFLAKKEVREVVDTMVEANNKAILNYLPNLLMEVIEAKIDRVQQDADLTIADASKKDIVEIAKTISDILKTNTSTDKSEQSAVVNFYQTLGFVASQDKPQEIINAQPISN